MYDYKYLLINRKTGKIWRRAKSREQARTLKREKGFKHVIVRNDTGLEVR